MKVHFQKTTDLFGKIEIVINNNRSLSKVEVASEEEANTFIKRKLTEIAADTVRKMYEQKAFFFRYNYYIASQALAYQTLGDYLKQDLTFDFIKVKVLTVLRDLIPGKTAQHYQLFNSRYEWLVSLCYGVNNDKNANELYNLYIQKQEDKILSKA